MADAEDKGSPGVARAVFLAFGLASCPGRSLCALPTLIGGWRGWPLGGDLVLMRSGERVPHAGSGALVRRGGDSTARRLHQQSTREKAAVYPQAWGRAPTRTHRCCGPGLRLPAASTVRYKCVCASPQARVFRKGTRTQTRLLTQVNSRWSSVVHSGTLYLEPCSTVPDACCAMCGP